MGIEDVFGSFECVVLVHRKAAIGSVVVDCGEDSAGAVSVVVVAIENLLGSVSSFDGYIIGHIWENVKGYFGKFWGRE